MQVHLLYFGQQDLSKKLSQQHVYDCVSLTYFPTVHKCLIYFSHFIPILTESLSLSGAPVLYLIMLLINLIEKRSAKRSAKRLRYITLKTKKKISHNRVKFWFRSIHVLGRVSLPRGVSRHMIKSLCRRCNNCSCSISANSTALKSWSNSHFFLFFFKGVRFFHFRPYTQPFSQKCFCVLTHLILTYEFSWILWIIPSHLTQWMNQCFICTTVRT